MRGHNVLFDVDNSTIGMAESSCDYKLATTGKVEQEFMDPYPSREEILNSYRKNYTDFLFATNPSFFFAVMFLNTVPFLLLLVYIISRLHEHRASNPFSRIIFGLSSFDSCCQEDQNYAKLSIKNSDDEKLDDDSDELC